MSSNLRRTAGLLPGVLLSLLMLGACSSSPSLRREPTPIPTLSTGYVLGVVPADAAAELEDLAKVPGNAAHLRRSWILLGIGRPEPAVDEVAKVLFGVARPAPSEEALARFIRAECQARMGHPERGSYDLRRATELAIDPDLQRRLQALQSNPADAPAVAAADNAAERLAIEPRTDWHPTPTIGQRLDPMEKVFRVTVHHSAMLFRSTSKADCADQIRLIQHAHMTAPERRYGDIGYHYLIDPAGRIWEGRSLRYQGAHARGDNNRGNVGICLLGNFVRGGGGQRPTPAQTTALTKLLRQVVATYHIDLDQIHGHRDFVDTECPGAYVETLLADIVKGMRQKGAGADHLAARE